MAEQNDSKGFLGYDRKTLYGTVIVGLFGAALFSFIAEPLLKFIGSKIVEIVGFFSSAYIESIYARVGYGLVERHAMNVYGLVFPVIAGVLVVIPLTFRQLVVRADRHIKELQDIQDRVAQETHPIAISAEDRIAEMKSTANDLAKKVRKQRRLAQLAIYLTALFSAVIVLNEVATSYRALYLTSAVVHIERSIEILAPEIDSNERMKLRSEYRSITTRDKFMAMQKKLKDLATAKSIALPNFDPI